MDDEKRSKERWERAVERTLKSLGASVPADEGAPHPEAEVLSSYVEARLPASIADRISSHLAVCERCSRIVLALARDEWPDDDRPDDDRLDGGGSGADGAGSAELPEVDVRAQLRALRARLEAEAMTEPVVPAVDTSESRGDLD